MTSTIAAPEVAETPTSTDTASPAEPTADPASVSEPGPAASADTTLLQLLDRAGTLPLVVRLPNPDVDAVVLARRDETIVEAMFAPDGAMCAIPVHRSADPVTDEVRRAQLLSQASALVLRYTRRLKEDLDSQRQRHEARMVAIRDYAIARHAEGAFCRDGLNDFLTAFDLEPYEPTVRVRFTITGSYLVRGSDPDDIRYDASRYLDVDLSQVDDVAEDSAEIDIHIDDVTELHDR